MGGRPARCRRPRATTGLDDATTLSSSSTSTSTASSRACPAFPGRARSLTYLTRSMLTAVSLMRPGRLLPRPDDDPLARCAFGRHSSLAWPSADEPLSPIDLLWSGQLASLPALRTFRRRLAHCQASNHIPFPDRFSTPASLRRTPVVHSLTTSSFNIGCVFARPPRAGP